MTFLTRVMKAQPNRTFCYGFLTNLRRILFMRVLRVGEDLFFQTMGPIDAHSSTSRQCLGTFEFS
jgi:hypothetical protein